MKKQTNVFLAIMLTLICALSFTACSNNNEITDWGEWTVLSLPSCTDDGVEVRASKSDSTVLETRTYAAALGHGWEGWTEVTAPTCLVDGVEKRLCQTCGNYDYQAIPALGCDFGDWIVTVTPTCFTGGSETRVCNRDPKHIETHSIDALGHGWNDWIITTAPTETTDGIETRICRNDGTHTETRTVAALGTDGLKYTLINDSTEYEVSIGTANKGIICIPAYYNGKPITAIASNAFAFYDDRAGVNLTSIIFIDNSLIEKIGNGAFGGCESLVTIELPKNLKSIGKNAFAMCSSLESITIPSSVIEINANPFRYCDNLKTIYVEVTKEKAIEKWGEHWGDGEYNLGKGIATIIYLPE